MKSWRRATQGHETFALLFRICYDVPREVMEITEVDVTGDARVIDNSQLKVNGHSVRPGSFETRICLWRKIPRFARVLILDKL